MHISDGFSINKLYQGFKYYDKLPLFAKDLNEYTNMFGSRETLFIDNIVGSGFLEIGNPAILTTGIGMDSPSLLSIKGLLCAIGNSAGKHLISKESMEGNNTLLIVGWFQNITATTTMYEYGGVNNDTMENDLADNVLGIQSTTRYQFRWDVCSLNDPAVGSIVTIPKRDSNGVLLEGDHSLTIRELVDYVYLADKPAEMDYVLDEIYVIPIMNYSISEGAITSVNKVHIRPIRETHEELVSMHVSDVDDANISEITILLGFDVEDTDSITVHYEGVKLAKDIDYTINYENNEITLHEFSRRIGETLIVTATR